MATLARKSHHLLLLPLSPLRGAASQQHCDRGATMTIHDDGDCVHDDLAPNQ